MFKKMVLRLFIVSLLSIFSKIFEYFFYNKYVSMRSLRHQNYKNENTSTKKLLAPLVN